jgi:hypothetical protein
MATRRRCSADFGPQYLDLVHDPLLEALPGAAPLRFAGFSFGAAIVEHGPASARG